MNLSKEQLAAYLVEFSSHHGTLGIACAIRDAAREIAERNEVEERNYYDSLIDCLKMAKAGKL